MAQLKSTVVQGALTVTGNVVANKLIKLGGTSDEILMADGTTSSKSDILSKINAAVTIKGTLGTGGTITSLPAASASNLGYGYKVITAGTYNSVAAKIGDMFICYKNGSSYAWMHIPSGDDIEDTWRPIKLEGSQILANGNTTNALNFKAGTNVSISNSSGTLTFAATDTGATAITTSGSGNAVTGGSYDASSRTITLTKGNSFLPLAGGTLTGTLGFKSNYIIKPVADYRCSDGGKTGAITITLPAGIGNTMVSLWIDVYNYVTDTLFSVHVGGYTYSNSTWTHNPSVMVYGADHKIRLGHNGTNFVIYIGELNSSWSYPQISVRDVVLGHNPTYSNWYKDWTISFTTSAFSNVTATKTDKVWTTKNLDPNDFQTSDTKVTQSDTTTANWRKVVLSYQDSSTAGTATTSHTNQVYVTPNIEVQPSTGNVRIAGSIYESGTALSLKYATKDHNHDGTYLPKTTYEWNKEYAAGSNGAVSLGRYNLYDTQLTFDITTTTSTTISGKLVIASQNGNILKVTVYGDASNTLAGYITIYQSAITGSRSWIEVFCNFPGWSKNKVHIYGVALNSATVTRQMASVTFTNGVPSGVTSGDTKWTGTIVNDITANCAAIGHTHDVNIATSTATNELTLAHGTKYALTAGGQSFVFTTPADNNTTYEADRGISLVSGKFGHSNTAITAQSTKGLYKISYDAYGHITGTESFTLPTIPDVSGFVSGTSSSTDNAIVRFNGTGGKSVQNSTATISDNGHLTINTTSDSTMATPAVNILHTGPADSNSYADLMVLSGFKNAPYGFKFRTYGNGTAIIQSQRINSSETFALSLNPNGGDVLINGSKAATQTWVENKGYITSAPNPANYYWANVKVSASSSTATTPSVQKIGITGSTTTTTSAAVTMEYDSTYKALKFVFA